LYKETEPSNIFVAVKGVQFQVNALTEKYVLI